MLAIIYLLYPLPVKLMGIILAICMWPTLVLAAAPIFDLKLLSSQAYPAKTYTQGIFFANDALYISSGLYSKSTFSKYSSTGTLQKVFKLPNAFFAEGAALADGEIYLLTWRENTVFVLDPDSLKPLRTLKYSAESWGLALAKKRLWRSDGSNLLHQHNMGDFSPAGPSLKVHDGDLEIHNLNELEWDALTGLMLANIYESDMVAAIDLSDGQVRFWLDGKPLRALAMQDGLSPSHDPLDVVLNGLAMATDGKSLWLTGKFWPRRYQVAWPPKGMP